jgi:hypothetical protein
MLVGRTQFTVAQYWIQMEEWKQDRKYALRPRGIPVEVQAAALGGVGSTPSNERMLAKRQKRPTIEEENRLGATGFPPAA